MDKDIIQVNIIKNKNETHIKDENEHIYQFSRDTYINMLCYCLEQEMLIRSVILKCNNKQLKRSSKIGDIYDTNNINDVLHLVYEEERFY